MVAQGFPATIALDLGYDALSMKAAGNAYPVPLVLAVLRPVLACVGESGVPLVQRNFKVHGPASGVVKRVVRRLKRKGRASAKAKTLRKKPRKKPRFSTDSDAD